MSVSILDPACIFPAPRLLRRLQVFSQQVRVLAISGGDGFGPLNGVPFLPPSCPYPPPAPFSAQTAIASLAAFSVRLVSSYRDRDLSAQMARAVTGEPPNAAWLNCHIGPPALT